MKYFLYISINKLYINSEVRSIRNQHSSHSPPIAQSYDKNIIPSLYKIFLVYKSRSFAKIVCDVHLSCTLWQNNKLSNKICSYEFFNALNLNLFALTKLLRFKMKIKGLKLHRIFLSKWTFRRSPFDAGLNLKILYYISYFRCLYGALERKLFCL